MNPLLVVAAIITHEGKILLAQRREDGAHPLLWEFPGGKLEPDEDPADCVAREIAEELAIEVQVEGVYDIVYHRYPERNVLILAYLCRWVGGDIVDLQVARHAWVAPRELREYDLLAADIPLARRLSLDLP